MIDPRSVPLLGPVGQRWKCSVCGDEPPNVPTPPAPPGIPQCYQIIMDGLVTYHCARCKTRMERSGFPQLRPILDAKMLGGPDGKGEDS